MIARGVVVVCLLCGWGMGQTPAAKAPMGAIAGHPEWPKARAGDVDSVEHILAALDAVISGPGKTPRDWERFRSLFVPDGRLIPVRVTAGTQAAASADVAFLSVDEYAARLGPRLAEQDFYERVIHTEVEEYGNIVQVFATFESRHEPGDKEAFDRGVDSYQLLKEGGRYWIVDLYYSLKQPEQAIPVRYLPSSGTDATKLNQNFAGAWVGQLEYRDFSTDERVFLPAWMTMRPGGDGRSVELAYVYDDGPGKTVRESSTLRVDAGGKTATLGADGNGERYEVAGLEEFAKMNRGTLVLTGAGKENGKAVDVRITVTLRRNLFTMVKETRPAGVVGEFKFRDGYTFTRADPPAQ